MKIYFAGPLFSEAERDWIRATISKIESFATQRGMKTEIIFPYELITQPEIDSGPLFPKLLQAGLPEILRHHHNSEFDVCIEGKTPWLGIERDLGRISHINDQDCCSEAVLLCKIDCLRFDVLQNAAQFLAHATVFDCFVELLRGEYYI